MKEKLDWNVYLRGEINQELADRVTSQIIDLVKEDDTKPINLIITSPGGEVGAGMQILDLIKTLPVNVRMFCVGYAYSMAAVIFASGKAGRYMLPHSRLLLHLGRTGVDIGTTAADMKMLAKRLEKVDDEIVDIMCRASGKQKKTVQKAMDHDNVMTAAEAIEFGICDGTGNFEKLWEDNLYNG